MSAVGSTISCVFGIYLLYRIYNGNGANKEVEPPWELRVLNVLSATSRLLRLLLELGFK